MQNPVKRPASHPGPHVVQVDAELVPPGPRNPHGNAFRPKETDLLNTTQAQRVQAPEVGPVESLRGFGVGGPGFVVQGFTSVAPLVFEPCTWALASRRPFPSQGLFRPTGMPLCAWITPVSVQSRACCLQLTLSYLPHTQRAMWPLSDA